jgi:hypothetical protein
VSGRSTEKWVSFFGEFHGVFIMWEFGNFEKKTHKDGNDRFGIWISDFGNFDIYYLWLNFTGNRHSVSTIEFLNNSEFGKIEITVGHYRKTITAKGALIKFEISEPSPTTVVAFDTNGRRVHEVSRQILLHSGRRKSRPN